MTTLAAGARRAAAGDRLRRRRRAAPAARRRDHRRPDRQPAAHPADDAGRLRAARQAAPPRRRRAPPAAAPAADASAIARPCPHEQTPCCRPLSLAAVAARARRLRRRPRLRAPDRARCPPAYKEAPAPARPGCPRRRPTRSTAAPGGACSATPVLNRLAAQVEVSNQNVAAAVAAYRAGAGARARGSARALFPSARSDAASARTHRRRRRRGAGTAQRTSAASHRRRAGSPTSGAALAPRRRERAAPAPQASAGRPRRGAAVGAGRARDRLLRAARGRRRDRRCSARTIDGYERALQITQNRYNAGIAPQHRRAAGPDPAGQRPAPTWRRCAPARALRARDRGAGRRGAGRLRASPPAPWTPARAGRFRSACRRRCCSAGPTSPRPSARWPPPTPRSASQRSAYFPSLTLERLARHAPSRGSATCSAPPARSGRSASRSAQTVFDAGATRRAGRGRRGRATTRRSRAIGRRCWPRSRASRTSSRRARSLAEQAELRRQASDAADQTEQQILNRYRAGQVGYTDVVTAQASALSARRALVQVGGQPAGERDRADPGPRRRLGAYRNTLGARLSALRQNRRSPEGRASVKRWKRPG